MNAVWVCGVVLTAEVSLTTAGSIIAELLGRLSNKTMLSYCFSCLGMPVLVVKMFIHHVYINMQKYE
jgi:hypothetical protein